LSGSPRPEERLAAFVRAEARRAFEGSQLEADPARTAEGWARRFVIERPRLEELVRLYEELGFEVAADPLPPAPGTQEGCAECPVASALEFRMIYTRPKRAT
jgi:hypothetical protein